MCACYVRQEKLIITTDRGGGGQRACAHTHTITPIPLTTQTNQGAARALSAQSAAEPAAAPLAAQAWERALAILNEGLSCLYPPPAALAAAAAGASSSMASGDAAAAGSSSKGKKGGGGGFAYAHHPEIAALLDRVAQVGLCCGYGCRKRGGQTDRDRHASSFLCTRLPTLDPPCDLHRPGSSLGMSEGRDRRGRMRTSRRRSSQVGPLGLVDARACVCTRFAVGTDRSVCVLYHPALHSTT